MRDVRLALGVNGLRGLRFGLGVWVLYYLRVTDYAGIGVVETVTILTAFALEIPTGIAADRWGRKRTLVLSLAIEVVGYLLLAGVGSLAGLVLSLLVLQAGRALYSGTYEAFLYETLAARGREIEYGRLWARAQAWQLGSVAAATLAGGFLYRTDPRLPFLCAAFAFALAAALAGRLREPERRTSATSVQGLGDSLRGLWHHRGLVLPLFLVGIFLTVVDEVLDDVLAVEFGFVPHELGALIAACYIAAAVAARLAGRGRRLAEGPGVVLAIGLLVAVSLALSPWLGLVAGGATVLVRYALRAVHDNAASRMLNAIADSSRRATLLSSFNALRSLPYVILAYPAGVLMDLWTARLFALWLGIGLGVATVATAILRQALRSPPSDGDH